MTVKLILSIIATILIIGVPVGLVIYMKKKRNMKIRLMNILIGIVAGFLCRDVILNLFGNLILMALPVLNSNEVIYAIFLTVLSSVIYLLGLYVIKRYLFKNDMSFESLINVVIGLMLAEALGSYIMSDISNLTFIIQSQDGTLYENLLTQLSAQDATKVIEYYESLPTGYYLYPGVMMFVSFCSNYLMMTLMVRKFNNKYLKVIGLFMMAAIIYLVESFTNPLIIDYANPILFIFAGILLLSAEANSAIMIGENYDKQRRKGR